MNFCWHFWEFSAFFVRLFTMPITSVAILSHIKPKTTTKTRDTNGQIGCGCNISRMQVQHMCLQHRSGAAAITTTEALPLLLLNCSTFQQQQQRQQAHVASITSLLSRGMNIQTYKCMYIYISQKISA